MWVFLLISSSLHHKIVLYHILGGVSYNMWCILRSEGSVMLVDEVIVFGGEGIF